MPLVQRCTLNGIGPEHEFCWEDSAGKATGAPLHSFPPAPWRCLAVAGAPRRLESGGLDWHQMMDNDGWEQ